MDLSSPLVRSSAILGFTFGACALRRFPILPLDRPAIALIGALATVGLGVLTFEQSLRAVNLEVIGLLLGMMITAGALAEAGVYAKVARSLGDRARERPRLFLVALVVAAAALSALVTNDTVCVFFAPLVIRSCRAAGRRPMPFLIALAIAANTGSAATLVGNPQNAFIGIDAAAHATSRLTFVRYAMLATPVAAVALAVGTLAVFAAYRRELGDVAAPSESGAPASAVEYDASLAMRGVGALALAAALLAASVPLALAALVAAGVTLAISGRDPRRFYARVDWGLLLFFAGLFVVTEGARASGVIEALRSRLAPSASAPFATQAASMTVLATVGSQIVSNVPFVLAATPWVDALGAPDAQRVLLALVSTFAGNLTLLGSVANLIVAGAARDDEPLGFFEHLAIGVPVTIAQVALALGAVVFYVGVGLA